MSTPLAAAGTGRKNAMATSILHLFLLSGVLAIAVASPPDATAYSGNPAPSALCLQNCIIKYLIHLKNMNRAVHN